MLCRIGLIIIGFVLISCTSKQETFVEQSPWLVPLGHYQQIITIIPRGKKEPMEFKGVLIRGSQKTSIVGLSPFNTTLFRITNEAQGDPKIEIFEESLKEKRESMLSMFKELRPVLVSPLNKIPKGYKLAGPHFYTKNELSVRVVGRKEFRYPKKIVLNEKRWEVQIENTKFQPL